jgi:hypothetical protein
VLAALLLAGCSGSVVTGLCAQTGRPTAKDLTAAGRR